MEEDEESENAEDNNDHGESTSNGKPLTFKCTNCGAPIKRKHIEVTNKHIIATCPYCEAVQYIKD